MAQEDDWVRNFGLVLSSIFGMAILSTIIINNIRFADDTAKIRLDNINRESKKLQ